MAEDTGTTVQEDLKEATCFEWPQGNALGDCLVELYDKCLWTDVKFRCEDHEQGEFIQAHKLVLAARSPVFQAMFFGPCSRKENEIVLKTAKSETLQLFLRYLYCDQITLTEEKVFAVLEMAHCYQVPSLVQHCVEYLTTVISVGNVCGMLTYAMQYDLTNLRNCCSFIDNNAEEVLTSDGFMNLSAECLLYILKGDTLNADEKLILEASEKWSRRKINERGLEETGANIRKCLGEAFYYLRLPTMTSKSFMECICRKGYFSVEEYAYISAFIGEVPGVSVYTNSCVQRCPEKEMLTINDECGDLVTRNGIHEVVDISVSKDVALTSFLFCEIKPVLKFDRPLYNDSRTRTVSEDTTLSDYKNEAIRVLTGNGSRVRVCSLVSKEDIDLPQNLQATLSGSVVVKDLDFKHTFSLHLSQSQKGRVMLEPPLVLKKRSSPYRVELKADFGCMGKVLIKTRQTDKNKIQSPTGQVKIETQYNAFSYASCSFAGIKAIELINFPNRDRPEKEADEIPQTVADETPLFTK